MKRAMKPRKDLDDDPEPARTPPRDAKMPRCVRCGCDQPTARALYTLCDVCRDQNHRENQELARQLQHTQKLSHITNAPRDVAAEKAQILAEEAERKGKKPWE